MSLARCLPDTRYVALPWLCKAVAVFLLSILMTASLADAAPKRVIAIGDSLTHGYGLEQGDGFVPQLEAWLQANGADAVVINMGVSGDTTEGGRARLDWALADGADAVLLELGGNDLLRGIDPARSRANLGAMLEAMSARDLPVLLAGMEAPLNYGPEYKAAFDGMYPELAEAHDALLYPSFLEGLVGTGLMQDDGIHPNAEGVAKIVASIGPYVLDLLAKAE